jgi:hypothetical protein
MARKPVNSSSGLVTIACKLPQGLTIPVPSQREPIKLHGAHSAYAIAGHGMTRGIKQSLWDEVESVYAEAAWLKNEHVFAQADEDSASDKAVDRKDIDAGFDPVDPANPNGVKGIGASISPFGASDTGSN